MVWILGIGFLTWFEHRYVSIPLASFTFTMQYGEYNELMRPDHPKQGLHRRYTHARMLDVLRSCNAYDLAFGSERPKCRIRIEVGDAPAAG